MNRRIRMPQIMNVLACEVAPSRDFFSEAKGHDGAGPTFNGWRIPWREIELTGLKQNKEY